MITRGDYSLIIQTAGRFQADIVIFLGLDPVPFVMPDEFIEFPEDEGGMRAFLIATCRKSLELLEAK